MVAHQQLVYDHYKRTFCTQRVQNRTGSYVMMLVASTTCMTDNQIDTVQVPSERVAVIEPNNANLAVIDTDREHFVLSIIGIIIPTNRRPILHKHR